jgi:hypothetical protein
VLLTLSVTMSIHRNTYFFRYDILRRRQEVPQNNPRKLLLHCPQEDAKQNSLVMSVLLQDEVQVQDHHHGEDRADQRGAQPHAQQRQHQI